MNIELYQRRITNRLEAVDLAGLDDKDIAGAGLEGFARDTGETPAKRKGRVVPVSRKNRQSRLRSIAP